MIIQEYRSSFSVLVLDGELNRGKLTTEDISNSGYQASHILSPSSLEEEFQKNPPHIIVLNRADHVFCGSYRKILATLQSLLAKLPELHVILLTPEEDLEEVCELYDHGIYDIIEYPVFPARQLLQSLDRAAQTDYYIYLNEQLKGEANGPDQLKDNNNFELFELFSQSLRKAETESEVIRIALGELHRIVPYSQIVFFRYVPSRSTLVAESSVGVKLETIINIGVELRKTEPKFREQLLLRPDSLLGLVDIVRNGFTQRQFAAFPVSSDGRVEGIVLFLLGERDSDQVRKHPYVRVCIDLIGYMLTEISLRRKLQKLSVFDESSEALNREFFLKKLREEITRARRINRAVSLLIIQVDDYKDIALQLDPYLLERFDKALVGIFLKNSRLTDMVGRLSQDQYGLALPHTERKGAAIKAERLRRIIETADFGKTVPTIKGVTISVGVSEYPTICHDASDLLKTTDEALLEVIKLHKNRVCVASPKENFIPDFQFESGK